jgi:S1-C subfamily serine protease
MEASTGTNQLTEQQLLNAIHSLPSDAETWTREVASVLERIPAEPEMEKTRGRTHVEVYKKAAPATILILTDRGRGSGAVINAQGQVLTNWHVIDEANRLLVVFKPEEGSEVRRDLAFAATVVKADPAVDLALLQIQSPPPELKPCHSRTSQQLR